MNNPRAKTIRLPLAVLRAVDTLYAALPRVECQRKCQACCSPVGDLMTAFERDRIIARTGKAPNVLKLGFFHDPETGEPILTSFPTKEEAEALKCNMLGADGSCTVYDIRPVICRIWGVSDKMPCDFGCKGSGEVPDAECVKLVLETKKITRDYEPAPARAR